MESSTKTAETVFKAFLFTDIVDSTDLKRRFGDEVAARVIAQHDALFRRCLEEHGGHERDNAGDGFLADFDVPSGAIRCALAFTEGLGKIDSPKPLKARVGAHMGETVRLAGEDSSQGAGKLVGLALDTAARVMNLARGSQILITRAIFDSARQQIKTSPSGAPIQWLAHGSYIFKGIGEPLEIFEVGIERLSPLSPPTDSDKASRAVAEGEELILGWRPGAGLNLPNRPHWQIEEKLGMGGFGEIWLVRHQKTNEKRAFKFCFQADRLRGLKREVTLFRLMRETLGNREDITRILDWQFDEAPYFIEAEYTEGGDLLAWAEAQGGIAKVSLRTRLKLVAEIAEALAAAHSVGVLHKDLKPSNILIAQTKDAPRAQLTDFGIGLLTDPGLLQERGITATGLGPTFDEEEGSLSGTQLYMAPELIEGKTGTTHSDIYALGVMLYQMVIGDFSRAVAPGWERDVDDELLREDITECVDGVPERRLASASELAERLRSLESRRSEREKERSTRAAAASAHRRRRQFAIASTVGLALMTVMGFFALTENRHAQEQAELKEQAVYNQYTSDLQSASALSEITPVKLAREGSASASSAKIALLKAPAPWRNFEWGYLVNEAWPITGVDAPDPNALPPGATAAQIWDGARAQVSLEIRAHGAMVMGASFNADGSQLSTSGYDSTAKVWSMPNGEMLASVPLEGSAVNGASFSPDGSKMAIVRFNGVAVIVDPSNGKLLQELIPEGIDVLTSTNAWFNDDGSRLIVAYLDGSARVWDPATGDLIALLEGHEAPVTSARFLPGGDRVMTASGDGSVRTWDTAAGKELKSVRPPIVLDISGQALAPDLRRAVSWYSSGFAIVWDLESGQEESRLDGHDGPIYWASFSADGTCLVTASADHTARVWDPDRGTQLALLDGRSGRLNFPFSSQPGNESSFSPDGTRIVTVSEEGTTQIWEARRDSVAERGVLRGHTDMIFGSQFSPDGRYVVTASYDKTARVWDAKTEELIWILDGFEAELVQVGFSEDASLVAARAWDGTIMLWDMKTGKPVPMGLSTNIDENKKLTASFGGVRGDSLKSIAPLISPPLAPSGPFGVHPGQTALEIFNWETGARVNLQGTAAIPKFAVFSPDSAVIAVFAIRDPEPTLYSTTTGRRILTLKGHEEKQGITYLVFSQDGQRILTTCTDGTSKIWDTETGSIVASMPARAGQTFGGDFSPDGSKVVTACFDQNAYLWDTETGELLATLTGHIRPVNNARFSPDGTRILTSTFLSNVVKIWDLEGRELLSLADPSLLLDAKWSPDGKAILTSWEDGTARLWRAVDWTAFGEEEMDAGAFESRLKEIRDARVEEAL